MLRLLAKLVLAAAVVAALWLWVPVRERTLAARWERAGSLPAFLEDGWRELAGRDGKEPERRAAARSQARAPSSRGRPTEGHTEADRRALDRVLVKELDTHR